MSDTIKPCPFCGEVPDVDNPATFRHEVGDRWAAIVCCIVGPEIRAGIYTPLEEWKDEAIAAWNERAAPAATGVPMPQEVREAILAALYNYPGILTYRIAAVEWVKSFEQQQGGSDGTI